RDSFKEVRFKEGFNIILAERTKEATKKDSRNGAGKTTLIEIIHFCLGASTRKNAGLRVKELKDWTFILDFSLGGKNYTVYRNTLDFAKVKVEGDLSGSPVKTVYDETEKKHVLSVKDWNVLLAYLVFGVPVELLERNYSMTFRSLISYFLRRGVGAFQSPFKHYPQQKEWDVQANNGFLLGLNWEYAGDFQVLKDNERTLNELKKAANQGLLTGYVGSTGQLEAERVTLEDGIDRLEKQLKSFKVHPQYFEIQEESNALTGEIHNIANRGTLNRQILEKYEDSVVQEKDVAVSKVTRVYEEAGMVFPGGVLKKLDEVSDFHNQLIRNRKEYLNAEIKRIAREIEEQGLRLERLSNKRAEL
ncbi:MAG: DUF2326 domain-containing protein, partial [bacterium]|nr:DUF2326 domain-containing protein [bacterium]